MTASSSSDDRLDGPATVPSMERAGPAAEPYPDEPLFPQPQAGPEGRPLGRVPGDPLRPASSIETRIEHQLGLGVEEAINVVWQVAIRLCGGNKADAEEITQDVMVAITRRVVSGPRLDVRNPTGFLRKSARTRWYSLMRRNGTRKEQPLTSAPEPQATSPTPESVIRDAETNAALTASIEHLQPHHREVITLLIVEGMSRNEIAAHFNLPVSTVKSQIRAAQADMRTFLRGTGWELD